MKKQKVTVILIPEDDGGYMAFFPLFPSCTTYGETVGDALRMAKDSLRLALQDPSKDDVEALELSHTSHVVVGEIEVEVPARAKAGV